MIRDTAVIRERFVGTVAPLPADDTISASRITAERKPAFYKPSRLVGPYSNVFEWRQVKLREELQRWDDMDLMAYISAHFAGLITTWGEDGLRIGRTMYTTRDGFISSRVTVSHGQAKYNNRAGYRSVALYIDGMKEPDWERAAIMTVREVQNLYVLRGTEAALYSAAAVVLLELRHFDEKMLEEAEKQGIPVAEDKVLVDMLGLSDAGSFVPENTWKALAVIFSFILEESDEHKNQG